MSASSDIDIIVKGKDEASEALRGVGDAVDGLSGKASAASGSGGGLGGLVGLMGGPVGVAAGAAGAALVGVGVAAFNMSADMDAATKTMQQQLGLTAEQAEAMRPAIEEVFASGLVGSAQEGAAAIAQARQQLKGLSDEDLVKATNQALRLSGVFGEDYSKVLNSVNTLQSQFGLSFDEAMNFVTAGFQRGLNNSGDFLDSIGEYSTQFSNGGADAGQFFSILESGLSGGILGTDKAADAFKEFGLRVADGSDSSAQALEGLGFNVEELWADMSAGKVTSADVFSEVVKRLGEVEDPVLRNQLGVALLGTQYEDLGASAVLGLDMSKTSLEDLSGATDTLINDTDSLGLQWEQTKRELLLALGPVGDELLKVAQEYMPQLKEGAQWLAQWLGENLPTAIDWTTARFRDFQRGVATVEWVFKEAAEGAQLLGDKIIELRDWLFGLKDALPWWLTPGSPTPFEWAVRGLQDEIGELTNSQLPDLKAGLDINQPVLPSLDAMQAASSAYGGAGGGQSIVINVAGSVISEGDLIAKVVDALRRQSTANDGLSAMGITT